MNRIMELDFFTYYGFGGNEQRMIFDGNKGILLFQGEEKAVESDFVAGLEPLFAACQVEDVKMRETSHGPFPITPVARIEVGESHKVFEIRFKREDGILYQIKAGEEKAILAIEEYLKSACLK